MKCKVTNTVVEVELSRRNVDELYEALHKDYYSKHPRTLTLRKCDEDTTEGRVLMVTVNYDPPAT